LKFGCFVGVDVIGAVASLVWEMAMHIASSPGNRRALTENWGSNPALFALS